MHTNKMYRAKALESDMVKRLDRSTAALQKFIVDEERARGSSPAPPLPEMPARSLSHQDAPVRRPTPPHASLPAPPVPPLPSNIDFEEAEGGSTVSGNGNGHAIDGEEGEEEETVMTETINASSVVHKGYLLKKGRVYHSFRRRYFILARIATGKAILVYHNSKGGERKGGLVLPISRMVYGVPSPGSVTLTDFTTERGSGKRFSVGLAHRTLLLQAESHAQKAEWLNQLSYLLQVPVERSADEFKAKGRGAADGGTAIRATGSFVDLTKKRGNSPSHKTELSIMRAASGRGNGALVKTPSKKHIAIDGYLEKQTESGWVTHWYEVAIGHSDTRWLREFRQRKANPHSVEGLLAAIDLSRSREAQQLPVASGERGGDTFILHAHDRAFYFRAQDPDDASTWVEAM